MGSQSKFECVSFSNIMGGWAKDVFGFGSMDPLSLVSCIANLNFELINCPESSFSLV